MADFKSFGFLFPHAQIICYKMYENFSLFCNVLFLNVEFVITVGRQKAYGEKLLLHISISET